MLDALSTPIYLCGIEGHYLGSTAILSCAHHQLRLIKYYFYGNVRSFRVYNGQGIGVDMMMVGFSASSRQNRAALKNANCRRKITYNIIEVSVMLP